MDAALRRFLQLLLWGVPAGLLVGVLAGRWMAAIALRAALAARRRGPRASTSTNLRQRLPVRGADDELDEVARAFNETLARVEHAVGEMRQFSTALAHELRTPIAALRGEIELAAMQAGRQPRPTSAARGQPARRARQAETADRSAADAGARRSRRDPARARSRSISARWSRRSVEQLEPVAQAQGPRPALRAGRRRSSSTATAEWLERLLLNLLDNAIKFTPPGGNVVVSAGVIAATSRGWRSATPASACRADVVPHVFERFYRADPARSSSDEGAGLGLSLVKWIVDRHDGTIDAFGGTSGQGSVFAVYLKKI